MIKKCYQCKKEKEVSEFGRSSKSKDGLNTRCRECDKIFRKKKYEEKKEQDPNFLKNINEYNRKQYKLNKDKIYQRRKEIKQSDPERFRKYNRRSYQNNPNHYREKNRKYRENNSDKLTELKNKWQDKNKDYIRETRKEYYRNNKEKLLYANKKWREENKEYLKGYWQSIKDSRKIISKNRRERKEALEENYSIDDLENTYELFNNKCYRCLDTNILSIDHHYPLIKGFPLSPDNAVILCRSCNSSKHQKLPENFYTFGELNILHSMGIMDLTEEFPNIENPKNDYY